MLKSLRKNTKIIIWAVVGAFVLWGGFSVGAQFQEKGRYAGRVFGKAVTFQEFNRAYQLNQILVAPDNENNDPTLLTRRTWENIILSREAKQKRVSVKDDEVRTEIKRMFEVWGVKELTQDVYERWLGQTIRLSPRQFEEQIRELIRVRKLIQSIYSVPIDPPTKEAILKRYLEDQIQITFEKIDFAASEDARSFSAAVSAAGLEKARSDFSGKIKGSSNEKINSKQFQETYSLPASKIFGLAENGVSEPFQINDLYSVFYIQKKETGSAESLTGEIEKEYAEKLAAEQRQIQLLTWNLELRQRARLEDFVGQK